MEHLHAVLDSPPLREAYNASLPKITQFWTELGQNQRLFEKYRVLNASAEFAQFPPARKKLVANALRDFRLGGAELPAEVKPRYAAMVKADRTHPIEVTGAALRSRMAWLKAPTNS